VEQLLNILRGWRSLPRDQVLAAFRAGNFAGVDEMERSEALFARVAPLGVADILMAVQYRYFRHCHKR
jgi:hypothetical protein